MTSTDLKIIAEQLRGHCAANSKEFANIKNTNKYILKELDLIKDNHLTHLKDDIGIIMTDVAVVKTNQKWMMMLGGGVGGTISGLVMAGINSIT